MRKALSPELAGYPLNVVLLAFLTALTCQAQTKIEVTAPRAVYEAVQKVQALSALPINYEDLRYDNPNDLTDAAATILTPEQKAAHPGAKLIIPKGGRLSTTITVNASSGNLPDALFTENALTAVLAAQTDANTPGRFRVESSAGVLFIEPVQQHSLGGSMVPATPILTTLVTVNAKGMSPATIVKEIAAQVRTASGAQIVLGMAPTMAFSSTNLMTFSANAQPAKYVLARFLAELLKGRPAAYHLLYDPIGRIYALNIWAPLVDPMK